MKMKAMGLVVLLGLSGCNLASTEDQLENSIREGLANQGTVEEVNLIQQDENNLTGYAMVRGASGQQSRLNCTAQRTEGTNFNWRCIQSIDESLLSEVEGWIRDGFAQQQIEVTEVDMQRAGDENNMAGYAVIRDTAGGEARTPCRAVRDTPEDNLFSWRCGAEAEAWAASRPLGRTSAPAPASGK